MKHVQYKIDFAAFSKLAYQVQDLVSTVHSIAYVHLQQNLTGIWI